MSIQENVGIEMRYKAYASGAIVPTVDELPGTSGGQMLRRLTSSGGLRRGSFVSAERRTDRQVADMRLQGRRGELEIATELSPKTYQDFFEALLRGTWAASITRSNTEFTSCAADNAASTFTVAASTWVLQGFRVGDTIRFSNMSATANNAQNFVITALSGVTATVFPAPTTQSADTSFSVVRVGRKLIAPTSAPTARKFAFERYHDTNDFSELFTEARIVRAALQANTEGAVTANFTAMARDVKLYETSAAPYFTSPAAAENQPLLSGPTGLVMLGGTRKAVVTGASINIDIGGDAPNVVGSTLVADIFTGTLAITGSVTLLKEDAVDYASFANELDSSLLLRMEGNSSVNAPFVSIYLPRIKFSEADVPDAGQQGGATITLPFQALLPTSTTTVDNSSIVIQDSESA